MTHVILYIAASVDGYIASTDGGVDWLSNFDSGDEDYGFAEFINSVDALVMGSRTYEQVLRFGDWPYPGKMSFVFSQRALASERDDVTFVNGRPAEEIEFITEEGFERIWLVGGSTLVTSFRHAGLIDDYILSTMPILLGAGIPLFESGNGEEKLELISVKEYLSGLVQTRYRRQQ